MSALSAMDIRKTQHSSGATLVTLERNRGQLRPGIDRLKVVRYQLPVPHSTVGTFLLKDRDELVVDFGELGIFHLPAQSLKEAERLESDLDPDEFEDAYDRGCEACWEGMRLHYEGGHTARALGFAKGWMDAKADNPRAFNFAPYNEVVRALLAERS